ncbi:MAG: hypothetical protein ACD_2C00015G0001 [uncultured bacterium (gcode 4)]|uniref:Mechanosensitive ion channel MscS domain-containing protein n=1 Tax=uncultured bacterium (gcode 4) TaxID=1234023 RepID=K2G7D1_9BACT|nr:MAG: hypothetical protein ACD_2C00015G0001 [uncultured bacterium (gcode 4)]
MKIRLVVWILLLIAVMLWYVYLKDYIVAITFFDWRYFDMVTFAISALIITYIITKIIDIVFSKIFNKYIKHDTIGRKMLPVINNITIIFIWAISIIMTINYLGFNVATLLTWAWIWWVIFALAWKEAASNLFGSFSLIFSKSFKPGDYIKIKWLEWTVEEITLSYTRLTDKKWNMLYIPNKNIITESIENLTQWKHRKTEIIFPLPLSISSKDLKKLLKSFEAFGDKSKKDWVIEDYKLIFDSLNATQNISFTFQSLTKADNVLLKKNVYLDLKNILDEQGISLSATA